ncbi:ankyrin repeat and SOCS box protein 2 [Triplophysa rosa]|nr:ankyrin repeat and SOCS box protein 2 [Triplophysa rosa]
MAVSKMLMPASRTTDESEDDHSAYADMSDEQLLQLAIKQSLAETNLTPWKIRQINGNTRSTAPFATQRSPSNPANPAVTASANPPSESHCLNINRDISHHIFSKNEDKVIAWTRHNGHLRVMVETVNDLDPFLAAIWRGDEKALRDILNLNLNILDEPNEDGWIPLHECAFYGHVECLKILLEARPDTIDKRTKKNQTPLYLAVTHKHLSCVEYLLKKGADPNLANNQWETPMNKACDKAHEAMVGILLKFGASPNKACVQGVTPLHEAVMNKNVQICKMLLQAEANLRAKTIYGIDPFFMAAQCGAVEVLYFLLSEGGNINTQANDGATALFEASKNGHVEVVKILLSNGADGNRANKTGILPIHIAAKNGHESIVALLNPKTSRTKVRCSGISPLHFAAERNRDDVLETLIEAGYDVNTTMSDDWSKMHEDRRSTALYSAVVNRKLEAASMLLEAGADPNLDIFNPLLVAARKGCMEMVMLLVEHGANLNALLQTHPTTFPTVLVFCVRNLPMMKYILDNGCDALSCFSCQYGSSPHPPIIPRRNGRERLYYLNEEPSDYCLQFCELLSAPSVSSNMVPIIDMLLDYVGHVKLCSKIAEHLDSNGWKDWMLIKEKLVLPCTLMHLSRLKIRKLLGVHRLRRISALPLPERLIKFLRYERESFEDILR